jgi:hypothetical protein
LLLQLVNAGLDAAESLLVPAATGQQLLQELMPPPLWPSELTQPEEAGQQVAPHVLNALGEHAVAASAGMGAQGGWLWWMLMWQLPASLPDMHSSKCVQGHPQGRQ